MVNSLLVILTFFLLAPGWLIGQVKILRNVQQELKVNPGNGGAKAILSATQVQTTLPDGQLVDGSLIALFDPTSHLFWWTHQSTNGPADPAVSMKDFLSTCKFAAYSDEIVCFITLGRSLWIRTSGTRVASLNEGLAQARTALPGELSQFVSGNKMWFQEVPLARTVGQEFFHPRNFGDPEVLLTVSSASRSASGWQIQIDNDKGESKTISLSRDFQTKSSK